MNTLTADPQDDLDARLPGRPRHRLLNRVTVPLLALLLVAVGFLGGIEAERGHGATAAAATAAGGVVRFPGRSGAASSRSEGGASGFNTRGGGGGSASGGFPGAGAGTAGGATTGTISSISGSTIDLKETSGTTITVSLTSATSLEKEGSVSRNQIRPGDTITVEGISGRGGSIKASSVSDAGHASSSSAAGGS